MTSQEEFAGIPDREWWRMLGWIPARGSACGFIADFYTEFSGGAVLGCLLLGMFYGRLWRNATLRGGFWTVLYIVAAALSIYVPTQSVSAFAYRFLFISVLTFAAWRIAIKPRQNRHYAQSPRQSPIQRAAVLGSRGVLNMGKE